MGLAPVTTFADGSTDACVAPDTSALAGVHTPTGSDAATYTYQCSGQYAGNWTNTYYRYDPATNSRTALYDPNFGYNCITKQWTEDYYTYSVPKASYYLTRIATTQPSGFATNCPVAPATTPTDQSTASDPATTTSQANPSTKTTLATGPGSDNTSNLNSGTNTTLNNATNATVTNNIGGLALTGDAAVIGNTTGGNATTGSASDQANVINLLQSSTNTLGSGQKVATFTANINGDVNGDLLFDPSTLGSVQNASGSTNISNDLTVNNSVNADLNNNIDLNSKSGNATVASNTTGGNATTGSAQAIANVMNYINSAVTAGQSFIGTININGNLNGDILLPPNLIDQLIASNVPTVNVTIPAPGSNNSTNTTVTNSNTVNNTNNFGIDNNVTSAANSGDATVASNTSGGNATSGSAMTNVTAFNLTGSTVIGENNILVFVNVVGKWVGLIVNAPAGATAASLGGGITRNTTVANDATLNNTNNFAINNDINVAAQSGDATVSKNTTGGNAKSGDAKTAVNLLNVENSTLNLANWFGILFINVFGNWQGSFGVNTSAGDPIAAATTSINSNTSTAAKAPAVQLFRFVPSTSGGSGNTFAAPTGNSAVRSDTIATPQQAVLAASIHKTVGTTKAPTPALSASKSSLVRPATIIGALVVLYIIADATISRRRARS